MTFMLDSVDANNGTLKELLYNWFPKEMKNNVMFRRSLVVMGKFCQWASKTLHYVC